MSEYDLNFSPITLDGDARVLIGRQAYDETRLEDLRREFRETHVLRRTGPNEMVDVPIANGATPIGNVQEEIDLAKWPTLWPHLLSAALVRVFAGTRDILTDRPVTVLGARERGLLQHADLPPWLEKRTLIRFDTRTIYGGKGKRSLGLVCETRVKNLILGNCAQLLELGVPLIGRYVQLELEGFDERLMKPRRLIGRVGSIIGDILTMEDHADGFPTIPAAQAFVEARQETVEHCVRHILERDAQSVLDKAEREAARLLSGPGRREKINETLIYLRDKTNLEAVPGVRFKFGPLLSSTNGDLPFAEEIPKPVLVFDPSGTRKDDWSERGIKNNGPYDQRTFSPKQLKIAVICQGKYEGRVDEFVAKFLDGIPATGGTQQARYADGFLRRFRLEKPQVEYFLASGSKTEDYAIASRQALAKASDEKFKWDLALVQVEEEFKKLADGFNPYYATKALFLKRDVAVQSIRLETMAQPDSQLMFSLNHVSLATYAKLGGLPWLLASKQTVAHELVIGLGSHSISASRIGARQRFVGITTVFSSDGNYLLSDRTAVVPFEEYADALYKTLKRAITTVRTQDNWRSTDKVRLVFHMFKPPKDTEAEAIKKTVEDLKLDNVTFAFIHLASDHAYLIFDRSQTGIGKYEPKKGVLGPPRGLHIKLGDRESLVVFSGASELKQASDGMPRPCLLKLHHLSTFTDMTYLARQAFEFSGHSWRMLAPERFPITIRYSDLIAERLTGLNGVADWDADAVSFGEIGNTLWFL